MFDFGGSLLAGQHDCRKEREPPARPLPVTFPSPELPQPSLDQPPSVWFNDKTARIPAHFLGIRKPSDVTADTLELLNVSFESQCDFETLVPYATEDGQRYLPPKEWIDSPSGSETEAPPTQARLLCNGRKAPGRNDFHTRAKEILYTNEDAFAALTRKPNPGQVRPRLAHFRKFWEGLDQMAYYWDNSLDEYSPPKDAPSSPGPSNTTPQTDPDPPFLDTTTSDREKESNGDIVHEPCKKQKTGEVSNGSAAPSFCSPELAADVPIPLAAISISSSEGLPARTAPPRLPWAMNIESLADKPADLSKGSYRGYRIGNGAEMPDQFRLDCVRGFLEPITWAFAVTFMPHRRPPVLCFENVRFPVRMNTVAWRAPTERMAARRGVLEGPLLGIQCRPEVFGLTGDIQAESILDTVRELGGILLLAQERAREGRTEKRAGEGKWWTTTPRWGGGPGGEVGDSPSQDQEPKEAERPGGGGRAMLKRRPPPAEIWKTLRAGGPLWDPKIIYEAIGKDRESDWDEVFMVSSINHHISVLKLRVHRLYLQFLAEATLPMTEKLGDAWWAPQLQRTRWYDLFDVEDRKEAMRGLWGVTAYLMRSKEEQVSRA